MEISSKQDDTPRGGLNCISGPSFIGTKVGGTHKDKDGFLERCRRDLPVNASLAAFALLPIAEKKLAWRFVPRGAGVSSLDVIR